MKEIEPKTMHSKKNPACSSVAKSSTSTATPAAIISLPPLLPGTWQEKRSRVRCFLSNPKSHCLSNGLFME
nr:hypothetical protein [Planococcus sp. MB-3u-03]